MFDIGVTELLVIAIVAIVVVGPKELPRLLRTIGQVVSKAKSMAREFQNQFEEAAEEAGVTKMREDFEQMADFSEDIKFDDPLKDIGDDLSQSIEVDDDKPKVKKPAKKQVKKQARTKKAKPVTSRKGASS
jgi:sec-independent protein translocase protein TatB